MRIGGAKKFHQTSPPINFPGIPCGGDSIVQYFVVGNPLTLYTVCVTYKIVKTLENAGYIPNTQVGVGHPRVWTVWQELLPRIGCCWAMGAS